MTQEKKKFNKKALFGVIALLALVAVFAVLYSVFREKPVEGSKNITIEVVDKSAKSTTYELKTDAMYFRQAMEEAEGLTFEGTESQYGMMVDTVNGEKADFDADGAYWSFYINDSYCNYGIDTQPIEDGDALKIVYEIYVPAEGAKAITIEVVGKSETIVYELRTDADYLRQAMEEAAELGLTFSGSESQYGMMVETVNGETADFNADGAYWSFYVNDAYCNYGVDSQPVNDGDAFKIVYEIYMAQ